MYNYYARKHGMPVRLYHKILLTMRLTTVILIISLMQVSAAGLAQKISLSRSNAPLKTVLRELKQQSGYVFLYSDNVLKQARPVDIKVSQEEFTEVLEKIFANQSLTYIINKNTITIKEKTPSFMDRIFNDHFEVKGIVVDDKGSPLPGATIRIKGTNVISQADRNGNFNLGILDERNVLVCSFVGYETTEIKVSKEPMRIVMASASQVLSEVGVVSTGYQKLPKERATGSFELVDNQLFKRSVGTDVFSRLNGITSLNFNGFTPPLSADHRRSPAALITIRGANTFLAKAPLIVVDNFPYDGDLNNINPNDVDNISILKDAAATSIWGTKAANGVIVITTKKGAFNQSPVLSLSSNVTITQKPDLFYLPQMSTSDYIDFETFIFNEGQFNGAIEDKYAYISPLVDLLDRQSKDPSNAIYQQQIDAMRNNDIRKDLSKYIYRNAINQQHAINISGGSKQLVYYLSGGYDKNLERQVTDGYDRINLRFNTNVNLYKSLSLETGIQYTQNKYIEIPTALESPLELFNRHPYLRLADDQGNPLAVYPYGIRKEYTDTAGSGRLLDWSFKPLSELDQTTRIFNNQDILVNAGLNYKLNSIFSASVKYQYEKAHSENETRWRIGSYYARNIINVFSQYSYEDKTAPAHKPIELGDIMKKTYTDLFSNSIRGQLNASNTWDKKHELNAIAGVEIRETKTKLYDAPRLYAYNDDPLTFQKLSNSEYYPYYNDPDYWGTYRIEGLESALKAGINRFTSIYGNAAYTYNKRYTVSASARKDAANLFGVNKNRRGQPLWSAGVSWLLSDESFFKLNFLNYVKLRVTYGYQGNVSNNVSAYAIIRYREVSPTTQLPFAQSVSPPNPNLGWESVRTINFAIDFSSKNNRLSGSLEYFDKRSNNLLSPAPIPVSNGFSSLDINNAGINGKGIELNLQSSNLKTGSFEWLTNAIFNYNRNKVSYYKNSNLPQAGKYVSTSSSLKFGAFIEGDDAYSLYTYSWAGLDPNTGGPRGYLNGQISSDYNAIRSADLNSIENHGSVSPLYFGAIRNTFNWRQFSFSFNVLYKFDYVILKQGINYYSLLGGGTGPGSVEYNRRWKVPGDELITNVPSFRYPIDFNSDFFYASSSANVISADHIRLQDINLSYTLNQQPKYIKNLRLFINMTNPGILWRANKAGIDPDAGNYMPASGSLSFGLNASF